MNDPRSPDVPGFAVRPIRMEDAPGWARYACLPSVRQHTSSVAETVADVELEIRRTLVEGPNTPLRFVLIEAATGALVATVGFHSLSALFGTAEITYDVSPDHWGVGIASAACRAATLWGFEAKGWHRIQATTVLANVRSQHVLERCGYRREGLLRNFRKVRGSPTDYWMYSAIPGDLGSVRAGP